jgi:predicted CoA-substrate-specific enzyme activase
MAGPCYLGIDIGSLTAKAVLLGADRRLLARGVSPAGYGGQKAARSLVQRVLAESHLAEGDVSYSVVTGYGRVRFNAADEEVSEISCDARGAAHLFPEVRTVIDIGGQDSKAIRLDADGRVADFAMNDKCAAGTGRFLEVMAAAVGVPVAALGELALQSQHPVEISSTCTVFAESEVVSHIARGATREDVAAGVHRAIAARVLGLAARVGLEPQVVLVGGVALNRGVVVALEREGRAITVPKDPQVVGALGAALYAAHRGGR